MARPFDPSEYDIRRRVGCLRGIGALFQSASRKQLRAHADVDANNNCTFDNRRHGDSYPWLGSFAVHPAAGLFGLGIFSNFATTVLLVHVCAHQDTTTRRAGVHLSRLFEKRDSLASSRQTQTHTTFDRFGKTQVSRHTRKECSDRFDWQQTTPDALVRSICETIIAFVNKIKQGT
jgi:hypothetical protein